MAPHTGTTCGRSDPLHLRNPGNLQNPGTIVRGRCPQTLLRLVVGRFTPWTNAHNSARARSQARRPMPCCMNSRSFWGGVACLSRRGEAVGKRCLLGGGPRWRGREIQFKGKRVLPLISRPLCRPAPQAELLPELGP